MKYRIVKIIRIIITLMSDVLNQFGAFALAQENVNFSLCTTMTTMKGKLRLECHIIFVSSTLRQALLTRLS
jgi:hypothetical protein